MDLLEKSLQSYKELMLDAEKFIWNNPETGYKEWKTHKFVLESMKSLGYNQIVEADDIPGFITTIDTGKKGPLVLILAELDSVICSNHLESDKTTGAVHACGHHAQCAALLGVAAALKDKRVLENLCGKIKLCFVPAEEGIEIEYRQDLVKKGTIEFLSGKVEFMKRGFFDDIDIVFMVHSTTENIKFKTIKGNNGLIRKMIEFEGKSSHAASPHKGINALYMANVFLTALNALRETFEEKDAIRVHPIITNGGTIVNAIPEKVTIETYVRGRSDDIIKKINKKVNRAIACSAASLGGNATITDISGSAALTSSESLTKIAADIMTKTVGENNIIISDEYSPTSSDIGDISAVFPTIQPYIGGFKGTDHGADYFLEDKETGVVLAALFQLKLVVELLKDNAKLALQVIEDTPTRFATVSDFLKDIRSYNKQYRAVNYTNEPQTAIINVIK